MKTAGSDAAFRREIPPKDASFWKNASVNLDESAIYMVGWTAYRSGYREEIDMCRKVLCIATVWRVLKEETGLCRK